MEISKSDNITDDNSPFNQLTTDFKSEVIKGTLKLKCIDSKTKITDESVELIKEVIKVLVVEAAVRASKQATLDNKTTVTLDHVEAMLPQLMLDFP